MKDALQELEVARVDRIRLASLLAVNLEDTPRCPRVDGWVHVAERPLVRRQLPVGMHVPLAGEQPELMLCELSIDKRERDAVEGQVPRGIPRIFPLVRH